MTKTILIVIDGCRPDALQPAQTPNLDRVMTQGAITLAAQTVTPSITLPAHFSIFTSQEPYTHSILTNTGRPMPSPSDTTLLEHIKTFGKRTAAIYSWEHLRNLAPPGALDHAVYLDTSRYPDADLQIADASADCLRRFEPDFMFIYLEGVDRAGHVHGWMSEAYMDALHQADTAVGIIREALAATGLEEVTVLIVHSDHGGSGNHHLEPIPENQTIPWMARGPGIRRGHRISAPVSVLDTAPTIARIMNIPCHYNWKGRPLREIFLGEGDRQPIPITAFAVMP